MRAIRCAGEQRHVPDERGHSELLGTSSDEFLHGDGCHGFPEQGSLLYRFVPDRTRSHLNEYSGKVTPAYPCLREIFSPPALARLGADGTGKDGDDFCIVHLGKFTIKLSYRLEVSRSR